MTQYEKLFCLVVIIVGGYFIYNVLAHTKVDTTQAGANGYKNNNNDSAVDNSPRTNEQGMQDGIPTFQSSLLEGYTCVRCTDSGANDAVIKQDIPRSGYQCPSGELVAWGRQAPLIDTQLKTGVENGNFIMSDSAVSSLSPGLAGLDVCKERCNQMTSKLGSLIGPCRAVTFNKDRKICQFFFDCSRVEKNDDFDTHLVDFDVAKQPTVIRFND